MQFGQRKVGLSLASHARGGPVSEKAVGRRDSRGRSCRGLRQSSGGLGKEDSADSFFRQRAASGGGRAARRQAGQRKAERSQGQFERTAQPLRATSFRLLELIDASTGAFGRFWREYRSVSSRIRADSSAPQAAECKKLFPSILPWHWIAGLTQPARSGRLRQRRRGRAQALVWTQQLWCLFNFFECGSPSSAEAVSAAIQRGRDTPLSSVHQAYATNLFNEVLAFCRQPKPDLGCRGVAKLAELLSRIRSLQYDNRSVGDLDGLASQAKTLDPTRMSLPCMGGILDPRQILRGEKREAFLRMPVDIPMCHC